MKKVLKVLGLIVLAFVLVAIVHILLGVIAATITAVPTGYFVGNKCGDIIHGR